MGRNAGKGQHNIVMELNINTEYLLRALIVVESTAFWQLCWGVVQYFIPAYSFKQPSNILCVSTEAIAQGHFSRLLFLATQCTII